MLAQSRAEVAEMPRLQTLEWVEEAEDVLRDVFDVEGTLHSGRLRREI